MINQLPDNSVYIELFGNSFLYGSINYERIIFHQKSNYLSGRIGAGFDYYEGTNIFSTPVIFNYIYNIHKDISFEVGMGTTIVMQYVKNSSENLIIPLLTGNVGIRIQSATGFIFRFGVTPFINFSDDHPSRFDSFFMPWIGITFGYSFK